MTDKKLKYINDLKSNLHSAKCSLAAWAGEGRAYEDSACNVIAKFLYEDQALWKEIDKRVTDYFKAKVERLQKEYDAI